MKEKNTLRAVVGFGLAITVGAFLTCLYIGDVHTKKRLSEFVERKILPETICADDFRVKIRRPKGEFSVPYNRSFYWREKDQVEMAWFCQDNSLPLEIGSRRVMINLHNTGVFQHKVRVFHNLPLCDQPTKNR
jgi:hypothetical protein